MALRGQLHQSLSSSPVALTTIYFKSLNRFDAMKWFNAPTSPLAIQMNWWSTLDAAKLLSITHHRKISEISFQWIKSRNINIDLLHRWCCWIVSMWPNVHSPICISCCLCNDIRSKSSKYRNNPACTVPTWSPCSAFWQYFTCAYVFRCEREQRCRYHCFYLTLLPLVGQYSR